MRLPARSLSSASSALAASEPAFGGAGTLICSGDDSTQVFQVPALASAGIPPATAFGPSSVPLLQAPATKARTKVPMANRGGALLHFVMDGL